MRHFHLEDGVPNPSHLDRSWTTHLGEALYTLTTSNFKWPDGVSYREMVRVRREVISGIGHR